MNMLRQSCPSCGRMLELPTTAIGRMAKCPACETTFRVEDPAASPLHLSPHQSSPSTVGEPPVAPSPYSAAPPAMSNPYQPHAMAAPVVIVEDLPITERSIEDIFSPTLSIFGARWAPLVLAPLLAGVIGVLVAIVPLAVLGVVASAAGNEVVVALGILALMPLILFAGAYLWVGLTRVVLAVARNQPDPIAELIAPIHLVGRLLLSSLIVMLGFGVGFVVTGALLAALAGLAAGGEAAMIVTIITIFVLSLATVVLQWVVWPLPFVISDGRSTAVGSILVSYQMAMHNKLTSFLLVLISFVLSFIGTSLCYVGQIVTIPLTMLLFAVAYLLITNQPIADPKDYQFLPPPSAPLQNH